VLALWTGQRQGDLIKLTWSQYDGTHIRLRQGKRKARVLLPVGSVLKSELDSRRPEKPYGTILRNTYGDSGQATAFGRHGARFTPAPVSMTRTYVSTTSGAPL
jgi:integrase